MKEQLAQTIHQRHLLFDFVRRNLRQKYVGSIGGFAWMVVQPILLLLVYTFVFSVILGVRFDRSDTEVTSFALYLYSGLVPWFAFSEAVSRATTCLVDQGNLIRNVRFPAKILPATAVVSELVNEAVSILVLLGALGIAGQLPSWTLIFLPLLFALQFVFTVGLTLALSAVHVFFRDIGHIVGAGLLVWMFTTPIFYPESQVPDRFQGMITYNPMAYLVRMYRRIIMDGQPPALRDVGIFAMAAAASLAFGWWVFTRNHRKLADLV